MPSDTATTTLQSLAVLRVQLPRYGDDVRLISVADGCSQWIEHWTSRVFVTRTLTEYYDGTGTSVLRLRHFPVGSITTLTILRNIDDTSAETISSSDYRIVGATGNTSRLVLKGGDTFDAGVDNVTVTYSAGYGAKDATTLPADVIQAWYALMQLTLDETNAGAMGASQVTLGPAGYTVKPSMPWQIQQMLTPYRRVELL